MRGVGSQTCVEVGRQKRVPKRQLWEAWGAQTRVATGRQIGRQNVKYERRGGLRALSQMDAKRDAKTSSMRGVGAQSPVPNGRQMGRQNVNYERRGRSSVGPTGTPKRQL